MNNNNSALKLEPENFINEDFEDEDDLDDDDLELDLDDLIEKYRDVNVDGSYDWWDDTYEEWKEKLEALGYMDPEISFSGFWSQGDGAGFTSGYDIDKFINNNKALIIQWLFPNISGGIDDLNNYLSISVDRTSHSYSHYNCFTLTVNAECEGDTISEEKLEEIAEELEGILEAEREDLCKEIYKSLEDEYEYLTSDECIKEWLISNDLWKEPEAEEELKAA